MPNNSIYGYGFKTIDTSSNQKYEYLESVVVAIQGKPLTKPTKKLHDTKNSNKIPWRWEKALHILNLLNQRYSVEDSITYCRILDIFIEARALAEGKRVHGHMIKIGFQPDVCLAAKLVSMYAKFGCIEDAHQIFKKIHSKGLVNLSLLMFLNMWLFM